MPTAKPVAPAKVAAPKKPTKKAAAEASLEKKVAAAVAPKKPAPKSPAAEKAATNKSPVASATSAKKSVEKLSYNFRTRSLVRTFVNAIDDPASKKEVRSSLKDLRSFEEIREKALELVGAEEFDKLIASWFNAGEEKSKN